MITLPIWGFILILMFTLLISVGIYMLLRTHLSMTIFEEVSALYGLNTPDNYCELELSKIDYVITKFDFNASFEFEYIILRTLIYNQSFVKSLDDICTKYKLKFSIEQAEEIHQLKLIFYYKEDEN